MKKPKTSPIAQVDAVAEKLDPGHLGRVNEEQREVIRALQARAEAAEKALATVWAWLKEHGHIDNHGHRTPGTGCAECALVNQLEELTRGMPAVVVATRAQMGDTGPSWRERAEEAEARVKELEAERDALAANVVMFRDLGFSVAADAERRTLAEIEAERVLVEERLALAEARVTELEAAAKVMDDVLEAMGAGDHEHEAVKGYRTTWRMRAQKAEARIAAAIPHLTNMLGCDSNDCVYCRMQVRTALEKLQEGGGS